MFAWQKLYKVEEKKKLTVRPSKPKPTEEVTVIKKAARVGVFI